MADLTSYPVNPLYWKSAKRKGWDEATKSLGVYLLSCHHRNLEGLYFLPREYMAADHGWTLDELERPFSVLLTDGFVMYDDDAEVILLPNALAYHTPKSENHIKGAMNALQLVPNTPKLWPYFLLAARRYAPRFFEQLGGDAELDQYPEIETLENPSERVAEGLPEAA